MWSHWSPLCKGLYTGIEISDSTCLKLAIAKPNMIIKTAYQSIFSRESDSTIANVRLSVCLSVCHRNPSASQNRSYRPSSLSTIKPIDHQAYRSSSLSTIEPIDHWAYRPLSLSTIKLIDHQAYLPSSLRPSSLLTIEPITHQAYHPSSLSTIKPIDHQAYRP